MTHAGLDQSHKSGPHRQRVESGHPRSVQSVAVAVETQAREAGMKSGAPGRVHGSHQPKFSFGRGRG